MTQTVVFTGVHNAGKSTLIEFLSNKEGFKSFPELGGELRSRAGCTSWKACEIFDELVMFREFERDKDILKTLPNHNVILLEQWHIGNIAHSKIRTPRVAKEYEERFERYLAETKLDILIIHLEIPIEQVIEREAASLSAEDVMLMKEFYFRLDVETKALIETWRGNSLFVDATLPKEVIYSQVYKNILDRNAK